MSVLLVIVLAITATAGVLAMREGRRSPSTDPSTFTTLDKEAQA